MVHKNYKWNVSKEKGRRIIFSLIETILKEKIDESIHIDELDFLLNNRTKQKDFLNNNKKKNIRNFIKVVFGGLIRFIDDYDEFLLKKINDGFIVQLNNLESEDWVIVKDL